MMLRCFASARLIASTPTPKFEMISSLGSASISLPSTGIGPKVARPRTRARALLEKRVLVRCFGQVVGGELALQRGHRAGVALGGEDDFGFHDLNFAASASAPRARMPGVGADGDEQRAALEPVARVGFVGGEDAGRLAGLADAADGIVDQRLHLGVGGLAGVAPCEACRSAGPMNTPSTPSTAQIASMLSSADLRLHLHQHADFLVRALGVVLHAPEARGARRAGDAAHARPAGSACAATALRASSAVCTYGMSSDCAPMSSTRFMFTMSFQGTRTIGCEA